MSTSATFNFRAFSPALPPGSKLELTQQQDFLLGMVAGNSIEQTPQPLTTLNGASEGSGGAHFSVIATMNYGVTLTGSINPNNDPPPSGSLDPPIANPFVNNASTSDTFNTSMRINYAESEVAVSGTAGTI